MSEHYF